MKLVTPPPQQTEPLANTIARQELAALNEEFDRRVRVHRQRFGAFWNSPATPDDILAAMGPQAIIWLSCAAENVAQIDRLAKLIGKSVADALPDAWRVPRRKFLVSHDYTVTLEPPAEGFDAWGRDTRPPPEPEPVIEEPQPEPAPADDA